MQHFGATRTVVTHNHAFIAPDGYVRAPLPGWQETSGIILISPHMRGPRFSMYIAEMGSASRSTSPSQGVERFVYVLDGTVNVEVDGGSWSLSSGGFAYFPNEYAHTLSGSGDEMAKIVLFEKTFTPHPEVERPPMIISHESEHDSFAFMGDEAAQLKLLMPDDMRFDMAVNLFTFEPGTTLPFAETHIMEHGMMMLQGGGIYRLDESWYPIQAGDVLWMGSYCPQWFGALGKTKSQYLYYKDINRDSVLGL